MGKKQEHPLMHHNCNIEKLYQFADGELSGQEKGQTESHLAQCPHCREVLQQSRQLAVLHQNFTQDRSLDFTHPAMTAKIIKQLRQGPQPWYQRVQRYFPKWVTVPVATAVLLLALALPWLLQENITEPSAIITSLTSESSSVMMFETPVSKQTVIWIAENSQ